MDTRNTQAGLKVSPSREQAETMPLMIGILKHHRRPTPAGATFAEVEAAYNALNVELEANKAAHDERRAQEFDVARRQMIRKQLAAADIDTAGMNEEQILAKLSEVQAMERHRKEQLAADAAAAQRSRRREVIFREAGCPELATVNLAKIDAATCTEWVKMRDLLLREAQCPNGFLVALLGPRGTGKTQLAVSLVHRLAIELYTSRYLKTFDVFRAIRATFGPSAHGERGQTEADVIASLVKVDFLILDEFHQRAESAFENNTLVNLLDRRYDARKCTLIISNSTKAELAAAVGDSVVSRIHEIGSTLETTWPSFRKPGGWLDHPSDEVRKPSGAIQTSQYNRT